MTIDEVIQAFTEAKEELGGDYEARLQVCCNGNVDFLTIDNILYSKIFGLRFEIDKPPVV
jgi:hypothetical protein